MGAAFPLQDRRIAIRMRTAGIAILVVGGLVFVGTLALVDWISVPVLSRTGGTISIVSGHGVTLWHRETRLPRY